jgi:hypothetical protein
MTMEQGVKQRLQNNRGTQRMFQKEAKKQLAFTSC